MPLLESSPFPLGVPHPSPVGYNNYVPAVLFTPIAFRTLRDTHMATKMAIKTKPRPAAARQKVEMPPDFTTKAPCTTEERLQHILSLGERIQGYIQYMNKVGNMNGTSAEAKERAVVVFHERLVILEQQLNKIQEELQLG